jgi:hypothetical protein
MLRDTVAKLDREKIENENIKWIHENLDDILASHPARWCLVDGGIVRLALVEFFDLFKTVSIRDDFSEGAVYFYASRNEPLAIFRSL